MWLVWGRRFTGRIKRVSPTEPKLQLLFLPVCKSHSLNALNVCLFNKPKMGSIQFNHNFTLNHVGPDLKNS